MNNKTALNRRVYRDRNEKTRADDTLSVAPLPVRVVVMRMARDHLLPMKSYLLMSFAAMAAAAATTGALPFVMQRTSDEIVVAKNMTSLYYMPLLVIVIICIKAFSEYVSSVSEEYIGQRITAELRERMFKALMYADLSWVQRSHTGFGQA